MRRTTHALLVLPGVPLPFDLATLSPGEPICGLLHTSAEVMTLVPRQRSHTTPSTVRVAVPNLAALAGSIVEQQVLTIERTTFGPPFLAMALSGAGRGTIGF
jgi:hypothetical protein